jgi:hypothetical protein
MVRPFSPRRFATTSQPARADVYFSVGERSVPALWSAGVRDGMLDGDRVSEAAHDDIR